MLEGKILANLIEEDGGGRVGILYREDDYGRTLAEDVRSQLTALGIEVSLYEDYEIDRTDFSGEISRLVAASVDTVLLVSFPDDGIEILREMLSMNFQFDNTFVYGTSPLTQDRKLGERINPEDPSVINGLRGLVLSPSPEDGEPTFRERLLRFTTNDPERQIVEEFGFAATSYDAVILVALASFDADVPTSSAAVADRIVGISRGGIKCSLYAECTALLREGENIDYDGASGWLEFTDVGEPSRAYYDVVVFENNEHRLIQQILSTP